MDFEWDEAKNAANIRRRGISFGTAQHVFDDPRSIDDIDDSIDYGEERSRIIGMVGGVLLTVIYTMRGGVGRIISARKATKGEHDEYFQGR